MTGHDLPPPAYLLQLLNGKIISRAVSVAADLAIADHLKDGPRTADELAAETGCHADALYRMLRTLSALGVFEEQPGRRFANNAVSEALRSDSPASVRDAARWLGTEFHWRVWTAFDHSVRTGRTGIDKLYPGRPVFEVLKEQGEAQEIFNAAMTSFSNMEADAITAAYDFRPIGSLVDVGGGHGGLAMAIKQSSPETKVTVMDLPHVIDGTRRTIASMGAPIDAVAGNMFEGVPPAEAYVMKHIIHDWNDDDCARSLGRCREALSTQDGRVLICEWIVTAGPEGASTKVYDLEMLAGPGGRERTEQEFADLLGRSGFRLSRVVRTSAPIYVIEGVRA